MDTQALIIIKDGVFQGFVANDHMTIKVLDLDIPSSKISIESAEKEYLPEEVCILTPAKVLSLYNNYK